MVLLFLVGKKAVIALSKFTTEVRYICETADGLVNSEGYKRVDDILKDVHSKIFDFDYPIFDEAYRPTLECNILRHYYTREIGAETVGLWKLWLDARMNEIMPYYNELYKTTLLDFNPLWDVDYTRSGDRTVDTTTKNTGTIRDAGVAGKRSTTGRDISERDTGTITSADTGTDTMLKTGTDTHGKTGTEADAKTGTDSDTKNSALKNTRWDLYSDTPQGGISGITGDSNGNGYTDVNDNYYLTNARKITDDGTGSTESTTKGYASTVTTTFNTTDQETRNMTDTRTLNTLNTKTLGTTKTTDDDISYTESSDSDKTRTLNTTEKGDNLTNYLETIQGKRGRDSYSKMIMEYRQLFLNIDKMIIEELSDLFFGLWE